MTSLRNIEPKLVVKLQPFGTERDIRVCIYTTVKPPKKVHVGDETFVPCREVVPFSEVLP